jgi:hypothetical protein
MSDASYLSFFEILLSRSTSFFLFPSSIARAPPRRRQPLQKAAVLLARMHEIVLPQEEGLSAREGPFQPAHLHQDQTVTTVIPHRPRGDGRRAAGRRQSRSHPSPRPRQQTLLRSKSNPSPRRSRQRQKTLLQSRSHPSSRQQTLFQSRSHPSPRRSRQRKKTLIQPRSHRPSQRRPRPTRR